MESAELTDPRFSTTEHAVATSTAARRMEGGETTSAAMGKMCSMESRGEAAISVSLWPKKTCFVKNNIYYNGK